MRHVTVPPELERLAAQQAGLLATFQCEGFGLRHDTRRRLVAAGTWARLMQGVYDTGRFDVDGPEETRARAFWTGILAAGPDAVAVGLGALWWHGCWGVPVGLRPEAGLPRHRGNTGPSGIRVRRFAKPWTEEIVRGRRTVDVETALIQSLCEVQPTTALCLLDSAVNRGLLDPTRVEFVRNGLRGRRGAAAVPGWWHLHDPRAESPLETRARIECHEAGLPPDELQLNLYGPDGQLLGRGDMGWRAERRRWVVAELDGVDVHSIPEALFRDRQRQNALHLGAGVTILRFTSADVRATGTIPRQVRAALRAA